MGSLKVSSYCTLTVLYSIADLYFIQLPESYEDGKALASLRADFTRPVSGRAKVEYHYETTRPR